MWKRVESDCAWERPRAPSVRLLFGDERATPALLEFLEDTRVGRMPGWPSSVLRGRGRTWRR